MQGLKHDNGKNRIGLTIQGFAPAIMAVGEISTFGAEKYAPNSWQKVENAEERYTDALFRHLLAHLDGKLIDEESGLSSLAHSAWNILALLTFQQKRFVVNKQVKKVVDSIEQILNERGNN